MPVHQPRNLPSQRPGPVGGKRDENRRRRTSELCQAALSLFVQSGVERVSIDEITSTAGISKGSFYRYFNDKPDLVDAILAPLRQQLNATFDATEAALHQATTQERLLQAYRSLAAPAVAVIFTHPQATLLYLQESRAPSSGACRPVREFADALTERSVVLAEAAGEHGLLRTGFDSRVCALVVVGAVEKLLFTVLSGQDLGDAAEVSESVISIVLDGLRVR